MSRIIQTVTQTTLSSRWYLMKRGLVKEETVLLGKKALRLTNILSILKNIREIQRKLY